MLLFCLLTFRLVLIQTCRAKMTRSLVTRVLPDSLIDFKALDKKELINLRQQSTICLVRSSIECSHIQEILSSLLEMP